MSALSIASLLPETINAQLRERLPGVEVVGLATDKLHLLPDDSQVLLAFRKTSGLTSEPIPGWPRGLKWIHLSSSGVDSYPAWFFEAGLPVTNGRGASALAVSEYALAAIFAHAKRIPAIWLEGVGQPRPDRLGQIKGSTLGLLGLGSIGKTLAGLAQALGMRVIALRQNGPADLPGVETARDIHALFGESDHLVLALPSTPQTRHIVGREVLGSARRGLHLINVARGALVDNQALLEALDSGQIAHATLDVTEPEPLPDGHPFYRHPGVSLSAHVSAALDETQTQSIALIVRNIRNYLNDDPLENRIR